MGVCGGVWVCVGGCVGGCVCVCVCVCVGSPISLQTHYTTDLSISFILVIHVAI